MAQHGFDPATFDPYRALGVARGATGAQIKRAHRTLAKRYHPDSETGDTALFLAVHEAYRVLSDPLLRREWDDRHAPGPVRADTAPTRNARKASARSRKAADPRAAPRSKRTYRWSASEVPWWEEGAARNRRARRPAEPKPATPGQPPMPGQPGTPGQQNEPAADFEVYNRSSGAAWSMAARAYFRRGDEDLPSRGQFHYQGTQVVTAGRARMAQQRAARRAAAAQPGPSTAAPKPETQPKPQTQPKPEPRTRAPREASGRGVFGRLRNRLTRKS